MKIIATAAVLAFAGPALAGSVTPSLIFGSGNANGSFTINNTAGSGGNVELGLRGKLRFNDSNAPENTFNWDGVDTYTFKRGAAPGGFGFDPNSPTTPVWSFEWSVNSDVDGTSGVGLGDLTYALSLDSDPTAGISAMPFDMINVANADHALGTNSTMNGGGTSDAANYGSIYNGFNVAQNSWNYEFFNEATDGAGDLLPGDFDPNDLGTYTITLSAFDSNNAVVATTTINISVVPMPTPLSMAGVGLLGVAGMRRRR